MHVYSYFPVSNDSNNNNKYNKSTARGKRKDLNELKSRMRKQVRKSSTEASRSDFHHARKHFLKQRKLEEARLIHKK